MALPAGQGARGSWLTRRLRGPRGRIWLGPGVAVVVYLGFFIALGDLRPEHVVLAAAVLATGYGTAWSRRFLLDMVPFLAVAVGYDLVRYVRPVFVSADRVLGCELRAVDLAWFGVSENATAQEWLAARSTPAWDVLLAVPYTVFLYVTVGYAAFLYWKDRPRMRQFAWSFAVSNYIAFTLWMIVPAAPPWYVHAHGCAIDLSVAPSAAGLGRVDTWLGISYYREFYARTASVFGALPSLHNAYPLLGLFTSWRCITWRTKWLHVAYFCWMFIASLYLDHHWMIDAVAGWATAFVAVWIAGRIVHGAPAAARP